MTSHNQLQAVQQEIGSVIEKTVDAEKALAAAEQAGDGAKVDFLRKRLEQLDKEKNSLHEKENILLQGQASGQHCLPCHHLPGLPSYNRLLVSCRPHTMLDDGLTLLASNAAPLHNLLALFHLLFGSGSCPPSMNAHMASDHDHWRPG